MAAVPSKPFSISFGSRKPKPTSATITKKRPHSALAEPDSDHEEESSGPQLVSAFDQSGAIVSNGPLKVQAPLVIQAEKNRDWREECRRKRRKNLLPTEVQAARNEGGNSNNNIVHIERDEVSKTSGIQFVHNDQDADISMSELEAAQRTPAPETLPPQTADEEALQALLGDEKKSTLQIPAIEASDDRNGYTPSEPPNTDYTNEDDRFRADVASRPDAATLDDYATVPVEEFGAAMLRGMGWKDGEAIGKRRAGAPAPKEPKTKERRPALLGIGAKETPGDLGDEFGAWGKAAKGKRKTDLSYSPVLLQNSKTGEMLTEEELKMKREEQGRREKDGDWRERRDRNLRVDQEKKTERRERERLTIEDGRGGERSRDGDSRRRDRSADHERRKRDRSRDSERRRRDRSVEARESRHGSSRRRRSRSRERSQDYRSSRRERSRSAERRHKRY